MERIETAIVGGGQAGLATSYYLTQQGREHVVLEQAARAGNVWRNERWDSFTLVTPNWSVGMPGAAYAGPEREAFMPRDEVVAYFERYVDRFQLPVQFNARVVSIAPLAGNGFRVITPERTLAADNVVVATGYEQLPRIPAFAAALSPGISQLHSSRYRNPEALPPGAVLVIGSAQSGAQIAEELAQRGRRVFLSVGNAGRAPRRYRGKDVVEWLVTIGFFDITPDKLPVPRAQFAAPHVSGANGGHTLNLHQFARDGMTLLGHVRGASGATISLAPDLHETLARVDHFEAEVQQMIDGYIRANGLEAVEEDLPRLRDGFACPILESLDLRAAGITTVIWATGYTQDYTLVQMPVLDDSGFPLQTRGVTGHAGLFFVGMPWMPSLKTGTLIGVAASAEHIASHIHAAAPNTDRRRVAMPGSGARVASGTAPFRVPQQGGESAAGPATRRRWSPSSTGVCLPASISRSPRLSLWVRKRDLVRRDLATGRRDRAGRGETADEYGDGRGAGGDDGNDAADRDRLHVH